MTDPDKYKVALESERVRVLEYRDKSGQKTTMHDHPDFLLYALAPFKQTLAFPDGRRVTREFSAGEVVWMQAQTHQGENTGNTETHVLIVELKEPRPQSPPQRETTSRPE